MDTSQIALVQSSLRRLATIADLLADLFYGRLVLLEPALEDAFDADRSRRTARLVELLETIVGALGEPRRLAALLASCKPRWTARGVSAAQIESAGTTWAWTLEQVLGESLEPAVLEAWREACRFVAEVALETSSSALVSTLDTSPLSVPFAAAPLSVSFEPAPTSEPATERTTWLDGFPASAASIPPASVSAREPISLPGSLPPPRMDSLALGPMSERAPVFEGLTPFQLDAEPPPASESRFDRETLPQGFPAPQFDNDPSSKPASMSW